MTLPNPAVSKQRLYYLDWVRVLAFGLLVFYHSGLIFVDWGYHILNEEKSWTMKIPMLFLNQWRLPLLFFVSGAGIRFALGRRSGKSYLGERFRRLFIPLVFGILVVVPPQPYYERLLNGKFSGSYIDFLPHFFEAGIFTWNHLWFIVYLFLYVLVTLPLFLALRRPAGQQFIARFSRLMGKGLNLLLLIAPLFVVNYFLRDRFPDYRNVASDWYYVTFSLLIFIYGYLIASSESLWEVMEKKRYYFLCIGMITIGTLYYFWFSSGGQDFESIPLGHRLFQLNKDINTWVWILCLIGFARRYLNFTTPALQYLNRAVYPFYILHQTVLIVIGYYVIHWNASIAVKYCAAVAGTFAISLLIYHFVILKIKGLQIFFGVK